MNGEENGNGIPRDYAAEMRDVITAAVPESDYIAAVIATELVEKLAVNDPDLLAGWLNLHAISILTQLLAARDRSVRATMQRRAGARRFGDAASTDDVTGLSLFRDVRYVVDDADTRRPLGEMTGADCRFAAAAYDREAKPLQMESAFLKALGKKAGRKCVQDVMSEEKCQMLRDSIVGQPE
jgi:hypothetical protein